MVGADDVTSPPSSAGFSVENKLTEDNISSDIFGLEKVRKINFLLLLFLFI